MDEEPPNRHPLVPWVQAVAMGFVAGLAAFDLTQKDSEVPVAVYALLGAIAIGVAPENIWNLFRGKKD